jgi:tetratricopeptide (TPR) repeat protein
MTEPIDEALEAGERLCDEERYDEAIAVFEAFLRDRVESSSRLALIHAKLGNILLNYLGRPEAAEKHFRKSTEFSPSSELASLGLYHALVQQQKVSEAVTEMRRLLKLRPSPEYERLVADITEKLKKMEPTEE